ncbi:uracil-DNA glycosylase family protein [Hydrogenophaga sp. XSHU_21]
MNALDTLADEITACRRCDSDGLTVYHPAKLYRGQGTKRVLVIGVQPGNTEKTSGVAFSGNAGTRLMKWLSASGLGAERDEIFRNVYLTSVLKCATDDRYLPACLAHCSHWLERQIELIQPKVVVTLGRVPLQALFESNLSLDDAVGRSFFEHELISRLFPLLPKNCIVVPLPHPSGMSRWPNSPVNRQKIEGATLIIKNRINA